MNIKINYKKCFFRLKDLLLFLLNVLVLSFCLFFASNFEPVSSITLVNLSIYLLFATVAFNCFLYFMEFSLFVVWGLTTLMLGVAGQFLEGDECDNLYQQTPLQLNNNKDQYI